MLHVRTCSSYCYVVRLLTVGVLRWVFDKTMSKKSAAVGTGAIAFSPLVDIFKQQAPYKPLRDDVK